MVESQIKIGDVCHDLVERGKLLIVGKAADTVAEYRDAENFDLAGYKSHPLLHVSDDDPVYTGVYLPKNPTTEFSGTYDFPASRLARIPVEEASEEVRPPQHGLIQLVLEMLFVAGVQEHDLNPKVLPEIAVDAGLDGDVVADAKELAESRMELEEVEADE